MNSKDLIFSLIVTLVVPAKLVAQQAVATRDPAQRVDYAVEQLAPSAVTLRHQIHQNPELGNREFETAKLVADHLRSLGLEVQTDVPHTDVVAVLKGDDGELDAG